MSDDKVNQPQQPIRLRPGAKKQGPRADFVHKPVGRITIVESVYHQLPGKNPVAKPTRHLCVCESAERPYERTITIGKDWVAIDLGWFKEGNAKPGLVQIFNDQKPPVPVMMGGRPPEKSKAVSGSGEGEQGPPEAIPDGVYISFDGQKPTLHLPPGESARFRPLKHDQIWLRSTNDSDDVTIIVYPK